MKKIYSIGYKDDYGDFVKVWENGNTRKFETIEEAETFIKNNIKRNGTYKIMQGWNIVKEISKEN